MARRNKRIQVSVIVCAYNEQEHLGQTLTDLIKCPTAEEIVVVNDGSTDKTETLLKNFGKKIKLVSYRKNRGKGYALCQGIKAAQGTIVVFLDAHLEKLRDKHLKKLVQPIQKQEANYVLAYFKMQLVKSDLFADLTGQRAYLKALILPYLKHLKKTRLGVETYLNEIYKPRWGKIVYLNDLVHLVKYRKMPTSEVLPAYLQEILEISKTKLEMQINQHRQLMKILNPKEIKSIKAFRKKVAEIKDKEVSDLIKNSIIPYLKRITG
ncbi:MAG TPA: glycosyltransferase family 2 protein [Candidatus Bathyarchaeia archaeon]|nr:glycosyltransferase family 2 protein [Candidatus Bathyarchaeia archaeon]